MPIYFTQPIIHGGDLPHTVPPPRQTPIPRGLSLGNYHIRDGWVSGIAQAVPAARIGSFGLMILTETKITDQ